MPLFMDIHKFDDISVDVVKKAHTIFKSVQDQYGVKYHQFWINKKEGLVFCLVEGPDKETCQLVHQTAHCSMACNIVEVEPGLFKLFMGNSSRKDSETVLKDFNYQHIMVVKFLGKISQATHEKYLNPFVPFKLKKLITDKVAKFDGRIIERPLEDCIVAIFNDALDSVRCAKEIQNQIIKEQLRNQGDAHPSFRIAINSDLSLSKDARIFNKALVAARRLCHLINTEEVIISSTTCKICSKEEALMLKSISEKDENFILEFFDLAEDNLSNNNFTLGQFCMDLGISRPQLYRKITSITGYSPIEFLTKIRMSRALSLMSNKYGNISEIASEVGYQNPSYFSKCFHKSYGCKPSEYIKLRNSA